MLSTNKITSNKIHFVHQYLWKEKINVLDFLHRGNNQEKIVFNTATAGWMWPGLLSHAQAFLSLLGVDLGLFGDVMVTLEVIYIEVIIEL